MCLNLIWRIVFFVSGMDKDFTFGKHMTLACAVLPSPFFWMVLLVLLTVTIGLGQLQCPTFFRGESLFSQRLTLVTLSVCLNVIFACASNASVLFFLDNQPVLP